jgi:hypothetical protein
MDYTISVDKVPVVQDATHGSAGSLHSGPDLYLSATLSKKLRAARAALGDKLCTHPASRFKPTRWTLLDEWVAVRRATAASGAPSDAKIPR